jgi:hypothetical protein
MRFLQDNPEYKKLVKINEAEIHWRDSIVGSLVKGAWNLGGWLVGKVEKGYKTVLINGKATEYSGVYMKAVNDAYKQLHGDNKESGTGLKDDEEDNALEQLRERIEEMEKAILMLSQLKKAIPSLQAIASGQVIQPKPRKPRTAANQASNAAPSNQNAAPSNQASNAAPSNQNAAPSNQNNTNPNNSNLNPKFNNITDDQIKNALKAYKKMLQAAEDDLAKYGNDPNNQDKAKDALKNKKNAQKLIDEREEELKNRAASNPVPKPAPSNPAPAPTQTQSNPKPAPSNGPSTHNNVWAKHEEEEKRKEEEAKRLKEEEERKKQHAAQHAPSKQPGKAGKGPKKLNLQRKSAPVNDWYNLYLEESGKDFNFEEYLMFVSEQLDLVNNQAEVSILENTDNNVNTSNVDKTYVKVLDVLDNIKELPNILLEYEELKDKKFVNEFVTIVTKLIDSEDLKKTINEAGDDKYLNALNEYAAAAIKILKNLVKTAKAALEQAEAELEEAANQPDKIDRVKRKIKDFIIQLIANDMEDDNWEGHSNRAVEAKYSSDILDGELLTEAFGVGNGLKAFTKKNYPRTEELKKLATSLVNVKRLKLLEFEAKNLMRIDEKKTNNAGLNVSSGNVKNDPNLEVVWKRAVLQVEDHFQDYIDIEEINGKLTTQKITKDEAKKSTDAIGAYTNTEITGVKEFVRKLTGYDKSVVFCLPVQKKGQTSYMLMRRIVDKRYTNNTLTGQNLLIHWFQVFGTYVPKNGKMVAIDSLGKGIQKIMDDGYMIAGLTTTSTTSPRTVYLYNKSGKLLLAGGKVKDFSEVESEFKNIANTAISVDEFKNKVDAKFTSGPWIDLAILSRGIVDGPKVMEQYTLDLSQNKYHLVTDGFERAHKNQKKLMTVISEIKT